MRKRFDAAFKAKVAFEAIKEKETISEIASRYEVHPNQVSSWKKQAIKELTELFKDKRRNSNKKNEKLQDELYQQIGKLKVELDWLKKNLDLPVEEKRKLIEVNHKDIPIYRQCELLGLTRSSFYYSSSRDDSYNEFLMRLIDEQYTKTPFYGILRMTAWLNFQSHFVNHKRVARLMRFMGIEAIYPKPKLSKPDNRHRKYPYLLKNIEILHPDHVWASDITYIKMHRGFVYLTAIMDWFSRFVLSWELSINLDTDFCLVALEKAFSIGRPEIFNSDQGSQYTSLDFTGRLEREGARISMDGRGRVFDNIFVERLWRTVKYEEVFLKDYRSVSEAREGINNYFKFYNAERFHQSLGYKTPDEVYRGYCRSPSP